VVKNGGQKKIVKKADFRQPRITPKALKTMPYCTMKASCKFHNYLLNKHLSWNLVGFDIRLKLPSNREKPISFLYQSQFAKYLVVLAKKSSLSTSISSGYAFLCYIELKAIACILNIHDKKFRIFSLNSFKLFRFKNDGFLLNRKSFNAFFNY
jgi:hypothetical protein